MSKKALTTQDLVNTFAGWTNTRQDEQSLGYQFLNSVGILFDDLKKQTRIIGDNYYLTTARVSDIDVYYRMRLPGDFEFSKDDNDNTDFIFTPPTVSGQVDGIYYDVAIAENNNIEDFWYNAAPDRLSVGATSSGEHLIFSGLALGSPLSPLVPSGLLHIPNRVWVTMSGGTNYLYEDSDNNATVATVHLEGITRAGLPLTEQMIFIHDDTQPSLNEFSEISQVEVYGVSELADTSIRVMSAAFQMNDYRIAWPELPKTIDREDMPLFWALASGVQAGQHVLQLVKYDADDVLLRLDGFVEKSAIVEIELLDEDNNRIVPKDLAVEPHSDNLWVVDNDTLYLYSADIPYPNMAQLLGKNYDAPSIIEPSSYWAIKGEDIQLDYVWKRPVNTFVKHRVWVQKPDGNKYSIENGAEVTYHTDDTSWVYGEPVRRHIRPSDIFTLDQYGDYIYFLEVVYDNDVISLDKRIVSVLSRTPRAQFNLSFLGLGADIQAVDIDSEYKIWVMDNFGTKFEIKRHYDTMIIDFKKKILYFREPYDQVRVF